ncbi:MAG TPA: Wzz/FepE/Etk N-terminal domain-containing protein, partial [Anaerolineae bacterium]|nr:Wzz/FepE/Etk N-terminal domain-containing protein [Anaerolineae bacterium]
RPGSIAHPTTRTTPDLVGLGRRNLVALEERQLLVPYRPHVVKFEQLVLSHRNAYNEKSRALHRQGGGQRQQTACGEVTTMDSELDAGYYLDVVLRQWKAVLVVFVVATLAAAVVSFIQKPTYQATVTMTEQSFEFFDVPRVATLDKTVVKLYPTLARTEAVEAKVIEALGPILSLTEKTPGVLMSKLTLRADKDNPAIFRIIVEIDTPEKATTVANTWAEQYMDEVATFQMVWSSQLQAVEQGLQSAEDALSTFREETGLGLVEEPGGDNTFAVLGPRGVQWEKKVDLLAEHQLASDNLRLLIESARLARTSGRSIQDLPLQLLDTPAITQRGVISVEGATRQQSLDSVIQLLESEQEVIDGAKAQLSTEVNALQQELAQDQLELERLTRDRDLAESAYKAMANELEEIRLFQTNTQILSRATGAKLVSPDPRLSVVLGAALGLAGGVAAAFALQYVQDARKQS